MKQGKAGEVRRCGTVLGMTGLIAYRLHFKEGIDGVANPGVEGLHGNGFDVGDHVSDGSGHEGTENKLPQFGMVGTLVEENGLFPQHPLFASRECRLEEIGLGD